MDRYQDERKVTGRDALAGWAITAALFLLLVII